MKQNIAGARRQDGRHQTNQPLKAVHLPSPGCSSPAAVPRPVVPPIVRPSAPTTPGTTPPSVRRYSWGLAPRTSGATEQQCHPRRESEVVTAGRVEIWKRYDTGRNFLPEFFCIKKRRQDVPPRLGVGRVCRNA